MLSQVKQSEGFSRPNLYRVEIHPPDPGPSMGSIASLQLNCDSELENYYKSLEFENNGTTMNIYFKK